MYVQDHLKSKREKKENSSLGKTYISYAKVGQQFVAFLRRDVVYNCAVSLWLTLEQCKIQG